MKVKLINKSDKNLWYYNIPLLGEYEVIDCTCLENFGNLVDKYTTRDFYMRVSNGDLFLKKDCQIVSDLQVEQRIYESGFKRDSDKLKPYTHNLQGYTRLRFGYLTRMGAEKYGDENFLKGSPKKSSLQSLDRHLAKYMEGDQSEDHLAAIIFNVQLIMLEEQKEGIKTNHYFKLE